MKQEHPYLLCIKDWIFSTIFSNFKFIPLIFCYTIYIYIYIYFRIHSKVSKAPMQQNGCRTHTGLVATQRRSSDVLIRPFFFLDSHRHAPIRADSGQNLPKPAEICWITILGPYSTCPNKTHLSDTFPNIHKNPKTRLVKAL